MLTAPVTLILKTLPSTTASTSHPAPVDPNNVVTFVPTINFVPAMFWTIPSTLYPHLVDEPLSLPPSASIVKNHVLPSPGCCITLLNLTVSTVASVVCSLAYFTFESEDVAVVVPIVVAPAATLLVSVVKPPA